MNSKGPDFYCFSPAVMIGTFAVENILLLYLLIRYKIDATGRLIAGLLAMLATFQFAEYHVCESIGTGDVYSRIGYVAITLLPPLGVHLVTKIAKKPSTILVGAAYGTGAIFALIFGFNAGAFDSFVCTSNYAVFHLNPDIGYLYTIYYYGWCFTAIAMCLKFQAKAKKKIRQALFLHAFGVLSFIVPTGVVNLINPTTMEGIPSIMCGFAVTYAFILTFGVAPRVLKRR